MSIGKHVRWHAARDRVEARRRFESLAARDGPDVTAQGRSRFYAHADTTALGIVLVHGLTNAPEQWAQFATEMYAQGHTVVVPRLPGHGERDRRTTALARVTADDFLRTVSEAIDIARGAADRVVVAGLSVGGSMATWLALKRVDVAHAVAIVPLFGLRRFPVAANRLVAEALDVAPNFFVPWDPGGDGSQIPAYGYPRFATRALAACLDIGLDAYRLSRHGTPAAHVTMLLNEREPACNNAIARHVVRRLERVRARSADDIELCGLPANHDIIDPTNPKARVDLVYPRLRATIEAAL